MKRHLERIDESIARDMAQLETQARDMAIVASMAPASAMLDSTRPRNVLKLVGHFRLATRHYQLAMSEAAIM